MNSTKRTIGSKDLRCFFNLAMMLLLISFAQNVHANEHGNNEGASNRTADLLKTWLESKRIKDENIRRRWLAKKYPDLDSSDLSSVLTRRLDMAENGDPDSQFVVGYILYLRRQDENVAWMTKSALQGNADAQAQLSSMGETNDQGSFVYRNAIKWGLLSAEQGNAYGQYNLALNLDLKAGLNPTNGASYEDKLKGLMWLRIAHKNGLPNGLQGVNDSLKRAQKKRELLEQSQVLMEICIKQDYKNC